jgi:exonuclease SbcD
MKILITADWHIGKKLHGEDLSQDIKLFFDWLIEEIKSQGINYLLVAGDIFDNNNPTNDATKIYYDFLIKLREVNCSAIIIAGNHDSSTFIDVPKELLNHLNIKVVGVFPEEELENIFIPLFDVYGNEIAAVAAIPFLQDRYIRQVGEGEGAKEISEKIKQGMKLVFSKIGEAMRQKYPNIPKIGMAHLHAQGTTMSEAERDIQIGNQEGISSNDLDQFDYLALGHIHTGQTVINNKIQYASSPISLSFSEEIYDHKVVVLEIESNKIKESFVPTPKNRKLVQISGTLEEVCNQVEQVKDHLTLQTILDIKVAEKVFNPMVIDEIENIKQRLAIDNKMKIVNSKIIFTDKSAQRYSETVNPQESESLDPKDVLVELIKSYDEADQTKLVEIFSTICADINQN